MRKNLGFVALIIAMFIGMLDTTITNIALPDITNYFHASTDDASWISTIYVIGLAVFMITAAKIADQFGRKKVMMVGLAIFTASSLMCGSASSLGVLIGMRFLQSIGGAIITPLTIPMSIELFGKEKLQKISGIIGIIIALAAASGPAIGGFLIEIFDWRYIFFVNIPLGILSLLLMIVFIRESYDETVSRKIDFPGSLFVTVGLFLFSFALLKGNYYGWLSARILWMFLGAALSLIIFIFIERKSEEPMVELTLFKEHTFTTSCICYFFSGFSIVAPSMIFNYFLQNMRGYSVLESATVIMTVSLTAMVAMPIGNAISDKKGSRLINFLGILIMSFGTYLLSKVTVSTSRSTMVGFLIVFGIGFGFSCQSLVSSIKHIKKEKSGIGSGVVNAARQVGTCVGIALLVSLMTTYTTDAQKETVKIGHQTVGSLAIPAGTKKMLKENATEIFMKNAKPTSAAEANIKHSLVAESMKQNHGNVELLQVKEQGEAIQQAKRSLKKTAQDKVTHAFSKTFVVSAAVMAPASLFGLFTDKKEKDQQKIANI